MKIWEEIHYFKIIGGDVINILLIGGTGSLGQAITRLLLNNRIASGVTIYSRTEYLQWQMQKNLDNPHLKFMIGDIRDEKRLHRAMHGIDYVINCAAMKHVPICQFNPVEAVKTNILGIMNLIDCALDSMSVARILNVTSDKSVYPVNTYGASKLIGESLVLNANCQDTLFSCYRPGNYFESRGNVFELWSEQSKHGYCTLTSEDMYRYFIDLEDAARIAVKCLQDMKGGEIFIPIMKEYKMIDLLKSRYPNAEVKIIGLREGERLHEPLFTEDEERRLQMCENYYLIRGQE